MSKPNESCSINGLGILVMSISTLLTSVSTKCQSSSDNQMWCQNVLLASRQRWQRLILVLIPSSVLFITAKVSLLTSPFLVSNKRILAKERTMLVLTVRLVGSSLPIIIQVCNMVRLVAARYPPPSGCVNGYKSIALLDQGGELYSNPDILNVFTNHHYEVHPTGIYVSHQNRPVERAHRIIGDHVRVLLIGTNLGIKF